VSGPDPEAAYFQAVEEFFVSRRGDPLFLSNPDWLLVRKWRRAGLPLRVVLRGIRDALDAHAHSFARERKVGSLAYCAHEVDAAAERWHRALATGGVEGGIDVGAVLLGFAFDLERARLGPAAAAVAAGLARELRARAAGSGLAETDTWLRDREAALLEAIAADAGPEGVAAVEREVEAALAPYAGRMPPRVLSHIRTESRARRLLEGHAIPRLSVFHAAGEPEARGVPAAAGPDPREAP
jgi:hypothetical protein